MLADALLGMNLLIVTVRPNEEVMVVVVLVAMVLRK